MNTPTSPHPLGLSSSADFTNHLPLPREPCSNVHTPPQLALYKQHLVIVLAPNEGNFQEKPCSCELPKPAASPPFFPLSLENTLHTVKKGASEMFSSHQPLLARM